MQLLSHHLSLPNASSTTSDMVSVDKYMQLQDSVPCKIRAKRGCATHPRSIAERVISTMPCYMNTFWKLEKVLILENKILLSPCQVRRTKISERMRKLQDLVPNMDKVHFT